MTVDLLRAGLPDPDPALAEALARPWRVRAAVEALGAARAAPAYATPTLARWFREARKLGSHDRIAVGEAVYGVIRQGALLEKAGAVDDAARVEAFAALLAGDRLAGLISEGPDADLAAALSLPVAIVAEWRAALGDDGEAAALARALQGRAPVVLRAQGISAEALVARLSGEGLRASVIAATPGAVLLEGRANLLGSAAFREGRFEVQDEASQRFVAALPLKPGDRVLDLCAGAGGKSLALAARGGRVRAWDTRSRALDELRRRAERARLSISVAPPAPADLVVVDAPCAGLGRLRREPALRWGLDPARHLAEQAALLDQGAALVRPGGHLAYATCSLLRAENERQPSLPGFGLVDERCLWPHRSGTDGFAWRIWRRA